MAVAPLTANLKHLTDDMPGIGGTIKQSPEDFVVEEQPLYEASGSGEHMMLFVEKRRQTTSDVVRRLAKLFSVRRSNVGYAGLKDKQAVTRQHFTVHVPDPTNDQKCLDRFEFLPYRLIWARRHHNKLRRGHLRGNRFNIRIRDVDLSAVTIARQTLERLARTGVPNFVGHQRYGYRQCNHLMGAKLIKKQWQQFLDTMLGEPQRDPDASTAEARRMYDTGDFAHTLSLWPRHLRHDRQALDALRQGRSPREAALAVDAQQLEFLVSAVQSAIFNQVLDERIGGIGFDKLTEGDLAWKHDSRAVFMVDRQTAEKENGPGGRVRTMQVSPSGPMWGPQMSRTDQLPGQLELAALNAQGLSEEDLEAADHVPVYGTRRPMRVPMRDPVIWSGIDRDGTYIHVAFELPRGSYATIVLREIMKPQYPLDETE